MIRRWEGQFAVIEVLEVGEGVIIPGDGLQLITIKIQTLVGKPEIAGISLWRDS